MKDFKPSELPINTIIDDAVEGVYIQTGLGWDYLNPCCSDCGERYFIKNEDADTKFKDFGIEAFPASVTKYILENLRDLDSVDEILEEAVNHVKSLNNRPTLSSVKENK
ncbi:hypothetical protein PP914_gp206 [Arthrobacter phage Qui]|uniref:Uncharacterized protein n=1 Tax=Arthrobacter phage Qui TaxID=2603260 RepID=A0A5B8WG40_9CAUD|nr:hypothetical protein PP914_gp206 [Arthrobacter phage Qui]QED11694.1 hypothetical protein SEA_QUI_206 [Arthrobacter phage Qui]QOC56525.1 hypothetical protein SEA_PAELLA_206 [Arthrobacter phage Paella]